jgi:uncharacterized hydrophobic protein (TIGR00271 family)
MGKFKDFLKKVGDITNDIDYDNAEATIKSNINIRGHTAYILAFAIIIASVGLNVNSVAVIIGAMLISPLMGPIIGFGLGLGTNDTQLIKSSLVNLAVMVCIAILASTLYFLISPLKMENPTELLARTNPTIYDVLIALFGGFAGMFEMSKKNYKGGTVLSGVAIATALMPPLCTVGYGLSRMNWHYFLGAFYLFCINSVFIALATYLSVKFMKFPVVVLQDKVKEKKLERKIALITILILIPSIWSAVVVVKENNFRRLAADFVTANKTVDKSYIYDYKADPHSKPATIELYIAGAELDDADKEKLFESAENLGLKRDQVILKESAVIGRENLSENDLVKGMMHENELEIKKRENTIVDMQKQLDEYKSKDIPYTQIVKEVLSQNPDLKDLSLTRGAEIDPATLQPVDQIVAVAKWSTPQSAATVQKLQNYLKVRLSFDNVKVIQER